MAVSRRASRRVQFTAKRFCGKCGSTTDQVYSSGKIEPGSRPDETFVKVESPKSQYWSVYSLYMKANGRGPGQN